MRPKRQPKVKGPVIQIDKILRHPVGDRRQNRSRLYHLGNADQGAEHTDIEDHRLADLLHDAVVHRQLDLLGIDLAGDLHIAAVGQKKAARADNRRIAVVGVLGQADQDIRLGHLREINLAVGDDDIAAGRAAPGRSAIALRLGGVFPFMDHRRLGQDNGRRDHPLSAGAGEYKSYSAHDTFLVA